METFFVSTSYPGHFVKNIETLPKCKSMIQLVIQLDQNQLPLWSIHKVHYFFNF